jgi:cyclophilin family peptidyl-prolyl cis-trans isomerase
MAPKNKKKTSLQQKRQKSNSNKNTWIAIGAIAVVVIIFAGLAASGVFNSPPASIAPTKILFQTTAGDITIDLRTDKPITSGNFINLVKEGKYDNTTFHRVMSTFMIQGGQVDGYVAPINDEIGSNNRNTQYTIAMAKTSQPNSATSEFFINTVDNSGILRYAGFDDTYTVFGTVIAGQDVIDEIANAPVIANPNNPSELSLPVNPVTIIHASIVS